MFRNLYSVHDKLRIVAFDPGVNLGATALDFDTQTGVFKVLNAMTLNLSRFVPSEDDDDKREKVIERLDVVKTFVADYTRSWQPHLLAHETAYVPHKGGGASIYSFASLVENIITIKFGIKQAMKDARIFEVNPTTMKISIVGYKSPDKTLVLKALIEDPKIDLSLINTAKLNQHNADAIGIGVTAVRDNITIKIIDGIEVFHLRGKSSGTKKSSRIKRTGK